MTDSKRSKVLSVTINSTSAHALLSIACSLLLNAGKENKYCSGTVLLRRNEKKQLIGELNFASAD